MTSPQGSERPGFSFIEQARNKQLARSLTDVQTGIVRKLILFSEQKPKQFEYVGGYRDDDYIGMQVIANIQGESEVGMGLRHYFKGEDGFYKKVGVKTPNIVDVNLFTDRETWDAVQKMYAYDWERYGLSPQETQELLSSQYTQDEVDEMTFRGAVVSDELWTYGLTDQSGAYAKVIGLPTELSQGREDVLIEGRPLYGAITTQVPMVARDFVLMRTVLSEIDKVIPEPQAVK